MPMARPKELDMVLSCPGVCVELAPVYINELLYHYTPCRSLRSSDSNFLVILKTTTITYGDRSFVAIAPKLWNQLPLAIRQSDSVDSYKRAMKTYLFCESSFFKL